MSELSEIAEQDSSTQKEKFNTQSEAFDADYKEKAHLQTTFNTDLIIGLSNSIQRWFPDTKNKPIKIVDLCCGHGKPTHDLLTALNKAGVNILQIVGYDVSPAQIEQAKSNYKNETKLTFADTSPCCESIVQFRAHCFYFFW